MARYTKILPMTDTQENIQYRVSQYLTAKKYESTTRDGQPVFQKGKGVWVAASFVRLTFAGGYVRLEAWIDAMGSEQDLEGFVGAAVKKPLKKIVAELETMLCTPGTCYAASEQTTGTPEALFASLDRASVAAEKMPADITKKEYYKKYASDSFRNNMKITAIVGYIFCGIGALAVFANFFIIVDVAIFLGLILGMHLNRSKGCAVAITAYGVISVIFNIVATGTISGWIWPVIGISALIVFRNEDKRYRERVANARTNSPAYNF